MSLDAALHTWFIPCPASQVAYLVRSPYWRSHVEVQPAVLCTQFASREERQAACTKWAVRGGAELGSPVGALILAAFAVSRHRSYNCKSSKSPSMNNGVLRQLMWGVHL